MNNPLISILEPRLLFDGAAVATAVEVLNENSFDKSQDNETKATLDKNSNSTQTKIAYVDSNLKDVETIVNDLQESNIEVKLIDDKQDSIKQVLDGLSDDKTYDEIHIFSHGSKGEITLGNSVINSSNIDNFKDDLNEISTKLNSGADILLYGCEIAKDDISKQFVDKLASFTKADIASSDDLTGSDALNANWTLEYSTGEIEAQSLVIESYDEVLSNAPILETSVAHSDIPSFDYTGTNVSNLFDNDISTNYRNSLGAGSGFTFDSRGLYVIDSITFTTSSAGSEDMDPIYYTIQGSNDNSNFTTISSGPLSAPSARGTDYPVESFSNEAEYRYYKIEFPEVRIIGSDLELSEVSISGKEVTSSSYTEDGALTNIADVVNISNSDSTNMQSALVKISEGFTAGDILDFVNDDSSSYGSITSSYDSSTGELTLTGTATTTQYENAFKAVTYHSTSDAPTFNSSTRTFTWQVVDNDNNSSNATKSFLSITASNDAPQLTVVDGNGQIQEEGVLTDSGSLTLVDPDMDDSTTTTPNIKSITGVQSDGTTPLTLTPAQKSALNKLSLTAGNSSTETIDWTYTIDENDIDFIAEGEKVTVIYEITSSDGTLSDTAEVTVEILGKDDGVDLVVNDTVGNIIEADTLTDSGTIDYDDLDATDTVSAIFNHTDIEAYRSDGTTEIPLTSAQRDDLILAFTLPNAGGNNKGSIQWEYTISENKLDFLSKDETITLKYDIEISNNGTLIRTEEVQINVTGSNDSPILTVNDGTGNIQEGAVLSDSGTLTLTDIDEVDTTSTSSNLSNITGYQSDSVTELTFTTEQRDALDKLLISAGTSNNETITWDYTVTESDLDFIGDGETVTLTYTIISTDSNNESTSQDIQIQITGANDIPVLTVNDLDGVITEGSSLTDSGTIDYKDVDSNDTVNAMSTNTDIKAYRSDGTVFSLTAQQQTDLTSGLSLVNPGGTNIGTIKWQYSIPENQIDFLAKDEKVVLKYNLDINNNGSLIDTKEIEVTINGTNDTPTLTINDGVGNILEGSILTDSGSLTLNDIDNIGTTDTTSSLKSITGVQSDGITPLNFTSAQRSALDKLIITAGTSNNETINWSYTISENEIDFIAKDEVVTVTYTITSADEYGQAVNKDIEVNITGSNDIPTLTINDLDGTITEGSGNLVQSGTIDYNDLDATDEVDASFTHSFIEAYKSDNTSMGLTTSQRDTLIAAFSFVDSGGGNQGSIQWQYSISEGEIDFLAQGESVVLRYDLNIRNNGVIVDTQQSQITINGTNDSPNITVNDGVGNIQEGSVLSDTGSISFEDVDLSNSVITVDSIVKSINGYYEDNSMMILDSTTQMSIEDSFSFNNLNPGQNKGDINWDFNITENELDFLAQNERIEATFTIRVTDSQGEASTQDITVRIDGSNDTPTITSKNDIGDLKESLNLIDNGFINLNDLDESNEFSTSFTPDIKAYKKDGTPLYITPQEKEYLIDAFNLSNNTTNNSGTVSWTYEVDENKIDFLSEDETINLTYDVQISDGFTSINEDIEINITGTNDKPTIISNEDLDINKNYNGMFNKDYSNIIDDIDRTDFLTYEFEGLPKGLSYDSSTGIVSGRLLEIGTFNITIKAYDNSTARQSISKDFTMKVLGEEPAPRVGLEYINNSASDLEVDTIGVENIENERVEGVINDNEELIYEVGKGFVDEQNQLQELNIVENTKTNIIKDAKIVISDNSQIELDNYLNQNYDSLGITIEEISYKDEFIEFKLKDSMEALEYEVFVINEKQSDSLPIEITFDEATGILRVQSNADVKIAFKAINQSNERVLILDIQNNKLKEIENSNQEPLSNSVSFKGELEKRDLENENYGDKIVELFQETKA